MSQKGTTEGKQAVLASFCPLLFTCNQPMFLLGTDKNSSGQFSWPTLANYCHLTPLAEVPSGFRGRRIALWTFLSKEHCGLGANTIPAVQLPTAVPRTGSTRDPAAANRIYHGPLYITRLWSSLMKPTRQNRCGGKIVQTLELLPRDSTNFVFPTLRTQDFSNTPYLSLIRGPLSPPVRRFFSFPPH